MRDIAARLKTPQRLTEDLRFAIAHI
jgi:hypothetical protein